MLREVAQKIHEGRRTKEEGRRRKRPNEPCEQGRMIVQA
jgi:hypothetical protein